MASTSRFAKTSISKPFDNEEFKNMIETIINKSNITEKYQKLFSSEVSLNKFKQALTTARYDFEVNHKGQAYTFIPKNYELLEFNGDRVINLVISQWIRKTKSHITNLGWLNQLSNYLKSSTGLSVVADKMGFEKFIIKSNNEFVTNNIKDDCVEAIMGAIVELSDHYEFGFGLSVEICYNILSHYLDLIYDEFRLENQNVLWTPVETLREFYDTLAWPDGSITTTNQSGTTIEYYYWPVFNINEISIKIDEKRINSLLDAFSKLNIESTDDNGNVFKLSEDLKTIYYRKEGNIIKYYPTFVEGSESEKVTQSKAIVFLVNSIIVGKGKKFKFTKDSKKVNPVDEFTTYFGEGIKISSQTRNINISEKTQVNSLKIVSANEAINKLNNSGYNVTIKDRTQNYTYIRTKFN